MAYNAGSPAAERQTTHAGYASALDANTYNSDKDSGDDLFEGYVPDTPAAKYETQPTQIIERPVQWTPQFPSSPSTPRHAVQVPASSPLARQVQNTPPKKPVASMMAPAGTSFRAPMGVMQRPAPSKVIMLDSDGEDMDMPITIDSSDDERDSRADIRPTLFGSKKRSIDSVSPSDSAKARSGMERFKSVMSNSKYDPQKSNGYMGGGARKPQQQTKPERAMPVTDLDSGHIDEQKMRESIARLRIVFKGSLTAEQARIALLACKGRHEDAVEFVANKSTNKSANDSDDCVEIPSPIKLAQPQMKRVLDGPVISIKDRYSKAQSQSRSQAAAPPLKRRKLMQGRKHPSSPVTVLSSSPVKPSSPAVSVKDFDDDTDSGVGSESEDDPELEARLVKYLNTCKVDDLRELTNTTKANAERMIEVRPFKNLDAARNVTDNKALKSGKKSTKAPLGDRIVDIALEMFHGYEAVDKLVARCDEIGKPLAEEMSKWGFDIYGASKDGELELVSFDAEHDSGIGSPSSGTASPRSQDADEDVKQISKPRKRANFLKKPDMMGEDVVVKDYQIVGLNWLDLMYRHKLSCMLADDMGLGKTCQIIAFLAHLVETGHAGPFLVIATASTLVNWLQEFEKFAPELIVEPYHGTQSERFETADRVLNDRSSIHVIVTTYDMAAKKDDSKFLRQLKPDVMICDEGHLLKNALTQKHQIISKIPANFRLILTGTPLQNNLQELATLLAFILPDVFKNLEGDLSCIFKHKATTRGDDHGALLSAQRIARARSMLTPFVLRRKKHQVLKHLPPKTCRIEYCDLHPAQKTVYDSHIKQTLERARVKLEGGKLPKADENNPLMQLRKAAIHPLLFRRHFTNEKIDKMADILRKKAPEYFDPAAKRVHLINEMRSGSDFWLHTWCNTYPSISSFDIPDLSWLDSGKVDAMVKLVKKYKANGDRVLIFSQFALVLDILEAVLNTSLITYTRIDGATKIDERQTLIDNFRDDESITAFLLTTKAGGTGINLMYANKVIIFDMSFNPQDDVQAENRAHRVGQTRDVEVVRLVTKGTIEENVLALGRCKLELDGRVAGEGESEEAGMKAVEKMLLDGKTGDDDGGTDEGTKKEEEKGTKRKRSQTQVILQMATQFDDEGEEMLV